MNKQRSPSIAASGRVTAPRVDAGNRSGALGPDDVETRSVGRLHSPCSRPFFQGLTSSSCISISSSFSRPLHLSASIRPYSAFFFPLFFLPFLNVEDIPQCPPASCYLEGAMHSDSKESASSFLFRLSSLLVFLPPLHPFCSFLCLGTLFFFSFFYYFFSLGNASYYKGGTVIVCFFFLNVLGNDGCTMTTRNDDSFFSFLSMHLFSRVLSRGTDHYKTVQESEGTKQKNMGRGARNIDIRDDSEKMGISPKDRTWNGLGFAFTLALVH